LPSFAPCYKLVQPNTSGMYPQAKCQRHAANRPSSASRSVWAATIPAPAAAARNTRNAAVLRNDAADISFLTAELIDLAKQSRNTIRPVHDLNLSRGGNSVHAGRADI